MKRTLLWISVLVALVAAVPVVSMDRFRIAPDDAESFDLSDLRDGETRSFGTGDRTITATRSGEVVALSRDGSDGSDGKPFSMNCRLDSDTCEIVTNDDGERVMVKIESHRSCHDGQGDCDDIEVIGLGRGLPGSHNVWVESAGDCDGPDCARSVEVLVGEALGDLHEARSMVFIGDGGDGAHGAHVIRLHDDGHATLRCPEGDATLRVEAEEADDVFLCPKHSTPMDRVEVSSSFSRKIKIGG
jgi:hypothetical protein